MNINAARYLIAFALSNSRLANSLQVHVQFLDADSCFLVLRINRLRAEARQCLDEARAMLYGTHPMLPEVYRNEC